MNAPARAPHAALVQAVQANCDIADARHAADLSMCNYLLQMREFFRWERGHAFGAVLPRAEVGEWIAARERRWAEVEAADFVALPLPGGGAAADPFDVEAVNARLLPLGWLYGAGLVGGTQPVFFLAECHATARREGLRVQQAGREWARGLAAPPAALAAGADGPIVLRRESLARACWERFEAYGARPAPASAFAAVLQAYGFDAGFDAALPRWLDDHVEIALLHELGEHRAGERLGPGWPALRASLRSRRARLLAGALRDHLADLGTTLPVLLQRGQAAPLHAWFAGYEGLRQTLFPGLLDGYRAWRAGDGGAALQQALAEGRRHFDALAGRLMDAHARAGSDPTPPVEALLGGEDAICTWPQPAAAR